MSRNAPVNAEERQAMSTMVMNIFDDWGLDNSDRHTLLGLPKEVRSRSLEKFRDEEPLPELDEVTIRAMHIIGIADALHTSYPTNASMGLHWMRRSLTKFRGRAPLSIMIEDGVSGMVRIRTYLDCTFAWDTSGSQG